MQIQRVLFSLALAFLVCANCVAQDEKTETTNPKAKKAIARAVKSMTTQMMKTFEPANLTDEQKEKASALVEKHIASVIEARKAQDSLLTDEQKKARTDAIAKAKEDGVKGRKVAAAGIAALGLSEEKLKEFNAAKKNLAAATSKVKDAIGELLTDEQKAAMPKKGKGKGKGKGDKAKGKKKDKDGDAETSDATPSNGPTQTVSLKLPGMTWGGCARSVRTALSSVEGIADIVTDPKDNTCSFSAPEGLDVESTLNDFAEKGNKHIKGWSLAESE